MLLQSKFNDESFNDEKIKLQVLQEANQNRHNGEAHSHDQERSKLNSSIDVNSGAHKLSHDKIIEGPFNKNNVTTIKP